MARELADIAKDLDVLATRTSGGVGRQARVLADDLWEAAGGREPLAEGDPRLPTPGPGVRMPAEPTVVDSLGEVEDKPAEPVPTPTPTPTPTPAPAPERHTRKAPEGDKPAG